MDRLHRCNISIELSALLPDQICPPVDDLIKTDGEGLDEDDEAGEGGDEGKGPDARTAEGEIAEVEAQQGAQISHNDYKVFVTVSSIV